MEKQVCASCGKSKANLTCGICGDALCKSCTQFLEPEQFSFLPKLPTDLSHTTYCETCYSSKVVGALEVYNEKMARAREITVFLKKQGKETRLMKRDELPVEVKDCPDYDEALLRLAFLAVQVGCNALIDVDLKSKKAGSGSYQNLIWSGTGMPTHVDDSLLVKDKSIWHNPN